MQKDSCTEILVGIESEFRQSVKKILKMTYLRQLTKPDK